MTLLTSNKNRVYQLISALTLTSPSNEELQRNEQHLYVNQKRLCFEQSHLCFTFSDMTTISLLLLIFTKLLCSQPQPNLEVIILRFCLPKFPSRSQRCVNFSLLINWVPKTHRMNCIPKVGHVQSNLEGAFICLNILKNLNLRLYSIIYLVLVDITKPPFLSEKSFFAQTQ